MIFTPHFQSRHHLVLSYGKIEQLYFLLSNRNNSVKRARLFIFSVKDTNSRKGRQTSKNSQSFFYRTKEKSTYSDFLTPFLPTYSVFQTIFSPTYSDFSTTLSPTYSVFQALFSPTYSDFMQKNIFRFDKSKAYNLMYELPLASTDSYKVSH